LQEQKLKEIPLAKYKRKPLQDPIVVQSEPEMRQRKTPKDPTIAERRCRCVKETLKSVPPVVIYYIASASDVTQSRN
jgi:hypothetical protein